MIANLLTSIVQMGTPAFLTDKRRHKIMAFLTSISTNGQSMSAASVAALLGNIDPERSLELAKEKI